MKIQKYILSNADPEWHYGQRNPAQTVVMKQRMVKTSGNRLPKFGFIATTYALCDISQVTYVIQASVLSSVRWESF